MRFTPLLAALLLLVPPFAAQAQPVPPAASLPASAREAALLERVEALLAKAPAGTRFGLLVEAAAGRTVLAIAPDQRFIPASNTKIVTTVAAYANLAALQAAARGTGVRIEPAGGAAVDVVLEGRGDAGLSSAPDCARNCLATLAQAVASSVQAVRNVVGDDSWYPDERWSPGMSWNNIPTRSGTGISALSIDDNETALQVAPAAVGHPPAVTGNGYYSVRNRALTVPGAGSELAVARMPGAGEVELSGTIGSDAAPATLRLGIDDPARYAAWRLRALLEARGVRVGGTVESRHRPLSPADDPARRGGTPAMHPPEEAMLAQLAPQDIAADIVTINKVSQNVHAELLLRRIARLSGSGSLADGQAAVAAMLAQAGVPEGAVTLSDGSGMSSYNRITPRAAVALLRWIATRPWGEAWRATLPVGGVDGTLARRFGGTALEGRVFAKTGSLNASRALSGYLTVASGETLVFSAFANDIPPGGDGAAMAALDAALLAIAAAN